MIDDYGIATSQQAVDKALKNAKASVHKTASGYKLMQKDERSLRVPEPGTEMSYLSNPTNRSLRKIHF